MYLPGFGNGDFPKEKRQTYATGEYHQACQDQPAVNSYRVTNNFADTTDGTGCGTATAGVSFELCSAGDIQIVDGSPGGNPVAANIPAVIFSQGKNWATSTALLIEKE